MSGYFGKYRGTVVDNIDPDGTGRIQVEVPGVTGAVTSWAMPCVPFAGAQCGVVGIPAVGANVWVEFEGGEVDDPIWVGGFWTDAAELPAGAGASGQQAIVLQTMWQNSLTIVDSQGSDGGVTLRSAGGASITVNDQGIFIDNGQGASIALTGPSVSINDQALVVT